MNLELDKSNWEPVKFGDVVAEARATVRDPKAAGIERVVGLEHIEPECVHLRQWASIDEGTTFTKGFKKGHVLFGRRRAYLKKAALADFDGICSGDITVLEAKERLLPELLPFLVCNDAFFDYAVKHSAGGLSPRTKFKDIANYEFLLPPKDQQAKLAELLWAADAAIEEAASSCRATEKLHQSIREHDCLGLGSTSHVYQTKLKCDVSSEWVFSPLREHICDMRYGTSKKGNKEGKGYSVVGIPHVINETLVPDDESFVELPEKEFAITKLSRGDILIVRTNGNPRYTGRSALFSGEAELVYASYLIKISADPKIFDPEYLVRYLQTQASRRYFFRHATSSAGNYNINTEDIGGLPVPGVPLQEQRKIVEKLKQLENARLSLRSNNENGKRLLKSLINEIFSTPV